MPEGKEKYLLNSLHQKLKNKISLKQNYAVKNLFLPRTNKKIKAKYLNSRKLQKLQKFRTLKKIIGKK